MMTAMSCARRYAIGILFATLLAGCATTPESLRGEFADIDAADASTEDIGASVRWGGRLLDVLPERERTCFEILALPLDANARPIVGGGASHRFLACRDGFLDPAAFPRDRLITVTGELAEFSERPIGDYDYRYPVLAADPIYLWAALPDPIYRYHDPYWRHDPIHGAVPRYRRIPAY